MPEGQRNDGVQLDLWLRLYFVLLGICAGLLVGLPIARFWLPIPQSVIDVGMDIVLAALITAQIPMLVGIAKWLRWVFGKEGRRQRRAVKAYRNT
jgi:hypothetical protein